LPECGGTTISPFRIQLWRKAPAASRPARRNPDDRQGLRRIRIAANPEGLQPAGSDSYLPWGSQAIGLTDCGACHGSSSENWLLRYAPFRMFREMLTENADYQICNKVTSLSLQIRCFFHETLQI
jgi:hypothetical protein